ncbi:MAG: hypothetical protein ACI4RA_10005, partial [Kiritimatiellia bacterium]
MKRTLLIAAGCVGLCLGGFAAEIHLTEQSRVRAFVDDPWEDLRPGLAISCRVRFDVAPAEKGEMTIVSKGGADDVGCYILRVDGPKEGVKFSFFVNVDGSPEPRVSVPVSPQAGAWHDVAAGWDGSNIWISVDGRRVARPRVAPAGGMRPSPGVRHVGPMFGVVRNLAIEGPACPLPVDPALRPGFRFACDATFRRAPMGETTLLRRPGEYWLRYDRLADGVGAFNLFVSLDGGWEPRASFAMPVEPGRAYRVTGGWTGLEAVVEVDGRGGEPTRRRGRATPKGGRLAQGTAGLVDVTNVCIRNERIARGIFGLFRTRELMPTEGEPATLAGSFLNIGTAVGACTITAKAQEGVRVTPARIDLPSLASGQELPLEWRIDPGTNGFAFLDFEVARGVSTFCRAHKRVVFMPREVPDYSARAWSPPLSPTRTYHVDAE